MPSTFDAEFLEAAAPDLLSMFGETVTLIPRGGQEFSLTAVVSREPAPLDDNRTSRRQLERCIVWGLAYTNTGDDPPAFAHDDGPVVPKLGMALVLESDTRNKWDFAGDSPHISGGMIGVRFQRIGIERMGNLTPGLG